MNRVILAAAIVSLALVTPASAQSVSGLGFLIGGPGTISRAGGMTLNGAGGGEILYKRAAGVLAEAGVLAPVSRDSDMGYFGVLSLNGIYHVRMPGKSPQAVSPFVTGGYSLFFQEDYASLWNFGGGLDWWLRPKAGIRVEFRDQYYWRAPTYHFWNVRAGVVFR